MTNNLSKYCLLVLGVIFSQQLRAQHFTASGDIIGNKRTGWYAIMVPTELRAKADENLVDLRIFDSKNREVPYLSEQDPFVSSTSVLKDIPIVHREDSLRKSSAVVVKNNTGQYLNTLTLEISNTNVIKAYNVSGSNDMRKWYGVAANQVLDNLHDSDKTFVRKEINFPVNAYKYIKIDFNDKKTLPINVLKVGVSVNRNITHQLLQVNPSINKMKNDGKVTRIEIKFNEAQTVNQIVFGIAKPQFYKRDAKLLVKRTRKVKHRIDSYFEEWANFQLSSNSENRININQLREKEFVVEIENQDNLPLSISSVNLYQIPVRIIANLDSTESYKVKVGNEQLTKPNYDIAYFENSIPEKIMQANIDAIQVLNAKATVNPTKSIWQQAWFMWGCIALVAVGIVYLSLGMLKGMGDEKP